MSRIRPTRPEDEQPPSTRWRDARAEEKSPAEREADRYSCPECASERLITDSERGEVVCDDCGLVVDEDAIDRGPEWRAFDSAERDRKARVGAPTTNLMHDKGLSTNIGWQNKDAYGRTLSANQRQTMHRLRTWNERFRTRDSKEQPQAGTGGDRPYGLRARTARDGP